MLLFPVLLVFLAWMLVFVEHIISLAPDTALKYATYVLTLFAIAMLLFYPLFPS